MNLKVGKKYQTRCGQIVTLVARLHLSKDCKNRGHFKSLIIYDPEYDSLHRMNEDGSGSIYGEGVYDLIKEYNETIRTPRTRNRSGKKVVSKK